MKLTRLRLVGFKILRRADRFRHRAGAHRRRRAERLRQVEPRRGAALGHGRDLAQEHARLRHGRRDLRRLGEPAVAQHGRSAPRDRQRRRARRPRRSTTRRSSTSRAASSARRARPTASTAARCAPATCSCCSPTPRPARARRPSSARARSARSSRPSRRRAAASSRTRPASPGCTPAVTRRSCGSKPPRTISCALDDVLREIDAQVDSLKQQGRQASRYKNVSAEIRRLEALLFAIGYAEAREQAASAEREARPGPQRGWPTRRPRRRTPRRRRRSRRMRCPALREAEAAAAAALQRLTHARNELEAEERRARERLDELERQIADLDARHRPRECRPADDAATIARLEREGEELAAQRRRRRSGERRTRKRALAAAEAALAAVEAELGELQAQALRPQRPPKRARSQPARGERARRALRRRARRGRARPRRARGRRRRARRPRILRAALAAAEETLRSADERSAEAAQRARRRRARREARSRGPCTTPSARAQRLETEVRTLAKLFASGADDMWPQVLDRIASRRATRRRSAPRSATISTPRPTVGAGALGVNGRRRRRPALPEGVRRCRDFVQAPAALERRLAQIGIVARDDGAALRARLRPGQRLVSREGDLWRWDGFTAAADAPSAAARRLAEKNRLGDLEARAAEARAVAEPRARRSRGRASRGRAAAPAESDALESRARRAARLRSPRERLIAAERREADAAASARRWHEAAAASTPTKPRRERRAQADVQLADLGPRRCSKRALATARPRSPSAAPTPPRRAPRCRRSTREAELRGPPPRRDRGREHGRGASAPRAPTRAERGARRRARACAASAGSADAAGRLSLRRRALIADRGAEADAATAADRLAEAETALAEADRAARAALEPSRPRARRGPRSQARLEAAAQRLAEITRAIADALETRRAGSPRSPGLRPGAALPTRRTSRRGSAVCRASASGSARSTCAPRRSSPRSRPSATASRRARRPRRGDQAPAPGDRQPQPRGPRAAARRLRRGQRHFRRLFTTLFGGGTAELTLIDSDDPLEAGLEIIARPPGKKPQSMTLLSGGEQALTAMALIFAVFLTNPSPICVLDEVDAPLDDAQRRALLRPPRRDGAPDRDALPRHHPQPDHHGAHEPPVRRHHGRARRVAARLRRPRAAERFLEAV